MGVSEVPAAALGDVRVLELGSMLAGPFVGSLLADFGAEVIKAEKPGKPDALREWPPFKDGVPLLWKTMARNKRLITLDIARPEAREPALALMERSDIVIENFRPGTMERWGFDPKTLQDRFPKLVWVRVSGWGQTGPYRGRGGYATVAEAFSGLASFTGFPDKGPAVSAFPLGDYLAGTFGAFGAMVAVHERRRSGRGQIVDVSLFEPLLRIIEGAVVRFDRTGESKARLGNQMEEDIPRNIYATKDGGHIAVSCGSQRIYENLLAAMGREDLKGDERFATMELRARHRDAIDGIVAQWMSSQQTDVAMALLEKHGVIAGKVQSMADVFADAHVALRGILTRIGDPELGEIRLPGAVPRLERTPGALHWAGRAPGADNDAVFGGLLGLARTEIQRLQAQGVM
ncbi:MAG: CoA transferase [Alphaproteobacteria bacterium]|nr:CoA transferase [Alphaproteobacteria bacterium]